MESRKTKEKTMTTTLQVNCTTGEVNERPLTAEELAQREVDAAAGIAAEEERIATLEALAALKASAKAKLVAGTPLTEEEAATLVI
jgi:hypothetical protein